MPMGAEDKVRNKAEELTGKGKETLGEAVGDEQMETEGTRRTGEGRPQAGRREGEGRLRGLTAALLPGHRRLPRPSLGRRHVPGQCHIYMHKTAAEIHTRMHRSAHVAAPRVT